MGYVLAVLALVLWGLVQIPIKMAKAPGRIGVMVSMPAGLLAVVAILAVRGTFTVHGASTKDWACILLTGLFQFPLATYLYFESIKRAGITNASPITRLEPILVVVTSVALGIAGLSWWIAVAAAMIFVAGLLLARGAHLAQPAGSHRLLHTGMLYAFVACFFWAAGDVLLSQVDPKIPRLTALLYGLSFGAVVHWTVMAVFGQIKELRSLTRRDWLCYAAQGVVSFALGYWAFYESVRLLGLNRAVVITGCWPLAAVAVGIVVFREPMNLIKLVGILLFIAAAVLAGIVPML
jgi:drug/metabolite transporter (DMT)-like permease